MVPAVRGPRFGRGTDSCLLWYLLMSVSVCNGVGVLQKAGKWTSRTQLLLMKSHSTLVCLLFTQLWDKLQNLKQSDGENQVDLVDEPPIGSHWMHQCSTGCTHGCLCCALFTRALNSMTLSGIVPSTTNTSFCFLVS